jgi:hypothetical protein
MDRRFSNATSSLADAALKLCTVLANYALADQGSSRAALYARPWPEVSRGPRASARNAIRLNPLGPIRCAKTKARFVPPAK